MGDKFIFYSTSLDKAPGKYYGLHWSEKVHQLDDYAALSQIPNWRSYLSNFDDSVSFEWTGADIGPDFIFPAGTRFRSIEHVFQAVKIAHVNPVKAYTFSINSGTDLGLGRGALAQSKRRLVVIPDMAFWDNGFSQMVMASAAYAKYRQNPDSLATKVLLATGSAELWHLEKHRGRPSTLVHFTHLETIRQNINPLEKGIIN